jgi:colanic acid/amylovoran biosynthesis glycosyltransferase
VRIAFLVNEFPVISETFILDQISWLIEHGCEVDIYTHRLHDRSGAHPEVAIHAMMDHAFQLSPPSAASEPARIARAIREIAFALPRNPGVVARTLSPTWYGTEAFSFRPFYRALPFLARKPYDVVHAHFGPNGILGAELKDLGVLRCPVLTQFHGYDVSSYVRDKANGVYRNLFAKSDRLLCVSERIRARVIELGGDRQKTRIHHTGVKVRNIAFTTHVSDADGGDIRLLTVGRLVEKKGVEFGLRAVAQLRHEYPNLSYTIVGDGPERDALTSLARELSLDRHVSFVGAKTRDTVAALMRDSLILLAPSVSARNGDEEGIPVVLMEALAAGLPVVSTTHAGIPELVSHGVSGLLASERDPEALADHVRFLITHPGERQSMALAGRRAVERGFDVDALNAQLLVQYQEIAERARKP